MKIHACRCCHRHQACACCPVHKDEAGTYATENARLKRQLAAALELLEERTAERNALTQTDAPARRGHC